MKSVCLATILALAAHAAEPDWRDAVLAALQLERDNQPSAACDLLATEAARLHVRQSVSPALVQVLRAKASVEVHGRRYAEAEESLAAALRAAPREESGLRALIQADLLGLYLARGQLGLAESAAAHLQPLPTLLSGEDFTEVLTRIGMLRREQHRYRDAEDFFRRALAGLERAPYAGAAEMEVCLRNNLACLFVDRGLTTAAIALLEEAIALSEPALGKDHPALLRVLQNLAHCHARQGESQSALPYAERCHRIAAREYGSAHPLVAETARTRASVLRALGRKREARALEAQARRIEERIPVDTLSSAVVDLRDLARR